MTGDNADYADKAELDDLIAVLKSGEYFDRRGRGRRLSGVSMTGGGTNPRNSRVLEFSRERPPSQASIRDSAASPSEQPQQN